LLIVGIILLLLLSTALGLLHVPLLSDISYFPPKPSRVVPVTQAKADELSKKIENLEPYVSPDLRLNIPFSEEELTSGLMINALKDNPNVKDAQIVLNPGVIEFYARLIYAPIDTIVKMEISIEVNPDGTINVIPKSAQVGSIGIPTFVLDPAMTAFEEQINKALSESKEIRLTGIEIRDKELVVRATTTTKTPGVEQPEIQ